MTIADFQERAVDIRKLKHPKILLSESRAAYLGPSLQLSPHKLSVATLVVGIGQPFDLDLLGKVHAQVRRRTAALIPPDTLHHLRSSGPMIFLYLDALSDDYEKLDQAALRQLQPGLPDLIVNALAELGRYAPAEQQIQVISQAFDLPQRLYPRDARITSVVRDINRTPQAFTNISKAAEQAGLSVPRFQHVFKDIAGTPFRRYRLWKRMAVVVRALNTGQSLTDAALEAGFSSSAHLSSAFRAMFGIKPSDLLSASATFEVDSLVEHWTETHTAIMP